jgi:SagB-type dehydrogenase family enzyme
VIDKRILEEIKSYIKERLDDFDRTFPIVVDSLLRYEESDSPKYIETFRQIPENVKIVKEYPKSAKIRLPKPPKLNVPLGDTILRRRSIREYNENKRITQNELSALLNYSYGIREFMPAYNFAEFPFRTVPTSGGLQGPEIYVVVNNVEGIPSGLYHFNPIESCLEQIFTGVLKGKMVKICLNQDFVAKASVVIIITAVLGKGTWKYSAKYYKFVLIDVGFIAQNIYLVATALNLGACAIAGFNSSEIIDILALPEDEIPVLLVSVGVPL